MFLKQNHKQETSGEQQRGGVGGVAEGAGPHLQLVIVLPAAAVAPLGRLLVGVEEAAEAAVVAHLDVLHTCSQGATPANQLGSETV